MIDLKTIYIGKKLPNTKYDFRETCFGICERENKILLVKKNNELSLVGGGIEKNESKTETLKREFKEEAGATIKSISPICVVDCYWLAAGHYPLRSLSNMFVVSVDAEFVPPTEEGHIPVWVDKDNVLNYLQLPYQIEGFKAYLNKTAKNNKCNHDTIKTNP